VTTSPGLCAAAGVATKEVDDLWAFLAQYDKDGKIK
jgi:hypothetical protein